MDAQSPPPQPRASTSSEMQLQTPIAGSISGPNRSNSAAAAIVVSDQVVYDLSLACDAEHASDESWQDATASSLEWILSLDRSSSNNLSGGANDKGKARESAVVHWYCGHDGAEVCWSPSVFLVRLLSMKRQGDVARWRDMFERLMRECPRCVTAFQHAKSEFINRYLSLRKSEAAIRGFSDGIERLERDRVHQAFYDAGFGVDSTSATAHLEDVAPAAIQNCLVNHLLFQDTNIVNLIASGLPVSKPIQLPPEVTPGLLALRFHRERALRDWTQLQLDSCELVTPRHYTHRGLGLIFGAHLKLLASRDRGDFNAETVIHLPYVESRVEFWQALTAVLALLDSETMHSQLTRAASLSNPGTPLTASAVGDIVPVVAGHLGDVGDHFPDVLSCFRIIVDRLQENVWKGAADRFEEVTLHAILDNTSFERVFGGTHEDAPATNDEPILNWIPPFLSSVAQSSTRFINSLAIIIAAFLGNLQALRFDTAARTRAITIAATILSDVFLDTDGLIDAPSKWPHAREAAKILDLHAPTIADFAFDPRFGAEHWRKATSTAMELTMRIMQRDARRVRDAIHTLGSYSMELKRAEDQAKRSKKNVPATFESKASTAYGPPPTIVAYCAPLWKRSYEIVRSTDARHLAAIVQGTSACYHLEHLTARTWIYKDQIRAQMKAVNAALDQIRLPLISLVESFTDEAPAALLDFLARPGITENFVVWALSPIEQMHNVAQGVVKQAYDVLTRRDCLGALLLHHPGSALRGLLRSLRSFTTAAKFLPEACGQAKRLVRCLSDVLDVLCATANGLLRDASFLRRGVEEEEHLGSRLFELWRRMCGALALVFKETPSWSTFFENSVMTEWMRDAILFGVDLLEQQHAFEIAIRDTLRSGTDPASTKQASTQARHVIAALSEPLEELTSWLRLNDEDLLSATFELVRSLLGRFAESDMALRSSTVARLRKIADSNRRNRAVRSNILRDDQLRELVDALAVNDGDEVVVYEVPRDKSKALAATAAAGTTSKPSASVLDQLRIHSARCKSSGMNGVSSTAASRRPTSFTTGKGVKASAPSSTMLARPRGVPWTSYTSKPAKAWNSSDDSSSEEDHDGENADKKLSGLAMLARAQKSSPKFKKITERRTVKMIDNPTNGVVSTRIRGPMATQDAAQDAAQRRAANIARLRGVQDYSSLHRRILQWDVDKEGPIAPHLSSRLTPLRSSFSSADDYVNSFEPLLLTECWEQVKVARTETAQDNHPIRATIAGRQAVDDFIDVFVTIDHADVPQGTFFFDTDLVLLRQGHHQTIAKVQAFARKREFFEATLRTQLGNDTTDAGPGLVARSQWQILKLYTYVPAQSLKDSLLCLRLSIRRVVHSLSTIHREYAALQSIRYLDLFREIISPRAPPPVPYDSRNLSRMISAYQVNEPQAKAIQGALQTSGFSLIQGPPGTGKTKTIIGLIGAFIDSRPRVAAPIVVGQPTSEAHREPLAKILLCAPSNAAVDEVAKRLKDGIRDSSGRLIVPKVVRIGSDSAVDISVKDIFLDELVERALSGGVSAADAANDSQRRMQSMRAEVDLLRATRDEKLAALQAVNDNDVLREELRYQLKTTKSQINEISQRLDAEKDKAQQSRRALDAQQRKMRMQVLFDADVICATLSGSGHDYMAQLPFDFETVIIDEAAQSIELSSLIPLKYGCRRCILVGDPLQLPPTVISNAAKHAGYDRSLFVRMMEQGRGPHLLSIQYRMHPHISAFPSAAFYQSRLLDGEEMEKKTLQPWHSNSLFPPYMFFHVRNATEVAGRHHSWTNPQEAQTALAIYERIIREYPHVDLNYRIGIVTPYKGQVWELKTTFRRRFGDDILSKISFNTVDGFQGQEKDIIILSCVRGGSVDSGVGFLADTRRMNVALTRARSSLFILGDSNKLRSNEYWGNLVSLVDPAFFRSLQPPKPPTIRATVKPHTSVARAIVAEGAPNALVRPSKQGSGATGSSSKIHGIKRRGSPPSPSNSPKKVKASLNENNARGIDAKSDETKFRPVAEIVGSQTTTSHPASATSALPTPTPLIIARPKPKPSMFITKKKPSATGKRP
ncbi:BZ3500_MvSof-1268-A1-R1_Chr1-3g01592 [Microbotryum saponariae]|uniref:BZ3500_MvSof-1268-A1-R1_Chr1-3g01592 protein n=1 Tax=Microbotryum saponariae TaxID=289078 RepID=A0A2X0M6B0_9BASI|nr:BZ3500_MvSof-1268-A1-R1_Chr1-3g01592 [Microbotryum saponariae]